MTAEPVFNPFAPDFLADPYPTYQRLRSTDPVHRSISGTWILTRHDDIKAVLQDDRFHTVDTPRRVIERGRKYSRCGGNLSELERLLQGFFIFTDPPEHATLTQPVKQAFAGLKMDSAATLINTVSEELLARLATKPSADLVADFAEPLAGHTIGRIIGMDDAQADRTQQLCHRVAPVLDSMLPLERYVEMNEAAGELLQHIEELIDANTDSTSFLGRMKSSATAESKLTATAAAIFFAGQETTVNGLSNAIHLIAQQDHLREDLVNREPSDAGWVQELLRYESPVQLTAREAVESVVIRDKTIDPGERVVLYIGAANRDPAVFEHPDVLDFNRSARDHLSFGSGLHRCLGSHLASEEIRQALPALFRRFPHLSLCETQPVWRRNITIRGHQSLPVSLKDS